MDKSQFEKILDRRAKDIFEKNEEAIAVEIGRIINHNYSIMNQYHSSSLAYDVVNLTREHIAKRKEVILEKIKQQEMDRILSSLDGVKFLFEQEQEVK